VSFEHDPLQKANEYAKAAMLRLEFLGLPPTPNNFTLMYAYASGRLPEIKAAMDEAVRNGGLSPEHAQAMYERHFGIGNDRETIDRNMHALNEELAKVMDMITTADSGTKEFNKTLSSFTGDLAKPLSVDQIRATVTKVVQETKMIAQHNQKLQEKLQESSQQLTVLKEDLSRAQKESLTDSLTGVGNRKHFVSEIKRLTKESREQHAPLSLLMVDIDHFKKFNDTHGHLVGDQVLKLVGRTMMENLKGRDVICRYGGEEFVVLLPQTRLADAAKVGDTLRQFVASKKIIRRDNNQSLGTVTISVGVAQYYGNELISHFLHRADTGVYQAKAAGRNRVVIQDFDPAMDNEANDRFSEFDSDVVAVPAAQEGEENIPPTRFH
jgi:diguanylate cyclase